MLNLNGIDLLNKYSEAGGRVSLHSLRGFARKDLIWRRPCAAPCSAIFDKILSALNPLAVLAPRRLLWATRGNTGTSTSLTRSPSSAKLCQIPLDHDVKYRTSTYWIVVKDITHGCRTCIKRKKMYYGKFFDLRAQKCIYRVSPQKKHFRMLLEPHCTGSITSSQHLLCLEINFLVGNQKNYHNTFFSLDACSAPM